MDAQPSLNGAILVMVIGEMSLRAANPKKFTQTFFLAQQPNGYFVLNDVLRFLKEEEEEEASVTSEKAVAPQRDEKVEEDVLDTNTIGRIDHKGHFNVSQPVYKTASAVAKPVSGNQTTSSPWPGATAAPNAKIWGNGPVAQDGWNNSRQAAHSSSTAVSRANKFGANTKFNAKSEKREVQSFTTKGQRVISSPPSSQQTEGQQPAGQEGTEAPRKEKKERKPRRESTIIFLIMFKE